MCGEKCTFPAPSGSTRGSPPRVRGKHFYEGFGYYGKGSPPRVRGKGGNPSCVISGTWITPACAGKSSTRMEALTSMQDHPRVCGEKTRIRSTTRSTAGSPPRVRGKGTPTDQMTLQTRITPACAGKSGKGGARRKAGRDHPRVCGEKASATPLKSSPRGSPPRVRGKAPGNKCNVAISGITPACAGKSCHIDAAYGGEEDHPRVCGEKPYLTYNIVTGGGSPPRVRGKVVYTPPSACG